MHFPFDMAAGRAAVGKAARSLAADSPAAGSLADNSADHSSAGRKPDHSAVLSAARAVQTALPAADFEVVSDYPYFILSAA